MGAAYTCCVNDVYTTLHWRKQSINVFHNTCMHASIELSRLENANDVMLAALFLRKMHAGDGGAPRWEKNELRWKRRDNATRHVYSKH